MTRVAVRMMAGAAAVVFPASYVTFTTTGSAFAPEVECGSGTVIWQCEETGQILTGVSPTYSWGSAATRHVRMGVLGGSGLAGITTVNLGYSHTQDAGRYGPTPTGGLQSPAADYDKSAEACSAVADISLCTGLKNFLAANGNLAGNLDFTGCSALEYIECCLADVQAVTLTGCTSLIRLCVEGCNLSTLDLGPVTSCLYDLRSAIQQGGTLTFTALLSDMQHLYHFCSRDQLIVNPPLTQLPALEELLLWNVLYYGALDLSGSPIVHDIQAHSNAITSIDLTGCSQLWYADLHGNSLDETAVDAVLAEVESWGTSSHVVNLAGSHYPSAAGLADVAALQGRGWTVTISSAPVTGVNSDDFARVAADIAAMGSEWYAYNGATATLDGADLVYTSSGYRAVLNPGDALPADYSVTATIPHATRGGYIGLVGRWSGARGVRLLFTSATSITIGDAAGDSGGNVTVITDAGFPASWSVDQDHTITMTMTGTLVEVFLDGQPTRGFYATVLINPTLTDTSYGICGHGGSRHWKSIAAA